MQVSSHYSASLHCSSNWEHGIQPPLQRGGGVGGSWYKALRKASCPRRRDVTISTPTTRDSLEGKERTTVAQRAFESVKEAKSMVPDGDTQRGRKVQAGEWESGSFLSTWVGDCDPGFLRS